MKRFGMAMLWCALVSTAYGKTLYFPHSGDGQGLSMTIVVSNYSDEPTTGRLSILNPKGLPQSFPFESEGTVSSIDLNLGPRTTRVFRTLGTSSPFKSGYLKLDTDSSDVGGVAIFQFEDGREASVLPSEFAGELELFVERNALLDTGVAVVRSSGQPIQLTVRNLSGQVLAQKTLQDFDRYTAQFLSELFSGLPSDFRGLLTLTSTGPFTAVGLRFGSGVLSTVPLDEPETDGTLTGSNLEVVPASVFMEKSSDYLTVNGRLLNHDLADACWIEVAIAAFDASGHLTGGETTYADGTLRRVSSSTLTDTCLRPGESAYFSTLFEVPTAPSYLEFFAVAEISETQAPRASLEMISSSISTRSYGWARVSGEVRNGGTGRAESIYVNTVLLGDGGKVLDIDFGQPDQTSLGPGETSPFTEDTTSDRSDVKSVDFRFEWDENSTSAQVGGFDSRILSNSRQWTGGRKFRSRILRIDFE